MQNVVCIYSHHIFLSLESRAVLVNIIATVTSENFKYEQSELRCGISEKIHTGVQKLDMK